MSGSAIINIMVTVARKVSRTLIRDFSELQKLQSSIKGPYTYANTSMERSYAILVKELNRLRPKFSCVYNGKTVFQGSDHNHTFIIKSICGNNDFARALPLFAVSICLQQQEKPIAEIIYDPILDSLYSAAKGIGSYLNDNRLRVSATKKLVDCRITTTQQSSVAVGSVLTPDIGRLLIIDSSSMLMAWLAAGNIDGILLTKDEYNNIAAGDLLMREAGACITEINSPTCGLIVIMSNGHIDRKLRSLVS